MRLDFPNWFSASFDSTPDLAALNALYLRLHAGIPVFFRRGHEFSGTLYLPPEAAGVVHDIRDDARLAPFVICDKPPDDGHMELLFGRDEDAARYFRSFRSNVVDFGIVAKGR